MTGTSSGGDGNGDHHQKGKACHKYLSFSKDEDDDDPMLMSIHHCFPWTLTKNLGENIAGQ
jgi:hypothetical protein